MKSWMAMGVVTDFNSTKEKIQQGFFMVFCFLVWNSFIMPKLNVVAYVKTPFVVTAFLY